MTETADYPVPVLTVLHYTFYDIPIILSFITESNKYLLAE
jgi:hypothetical protein